MLRITSALLVMMLMVPATGHTESPPNNRPAALTGGPLQSAASREATRFALKPASQAASPRKNWAARHPVLLGTMVGAGTGLTFLAAEGCDSSDYGCGGLVAFFGGTGALLGAGAGGIASIFLR